MKKRIILLGDSFTFGVGCSDTPWSTKVIPHPSKFCWGSLLSDIAPNLEVNNLAQRGKDNLTILEKLWQNMSEHVYVIIFCASYNTRFQIRHPVVDTETCSALPNFSDPLASENYKTSIENFYKYLYSDQIGWNYSTSSILAAYACARLLDCKFFWSFFEGQDLNLAPVVLDRIKKYQFQSCSNFDFNPDELAPCGHPNDLGHLRYFNQVVKPFFEPHLRG